MKERCNNEPEQNWKLFEFALNQEERKAAGLIHHRWNLLDFIHFLGLPKFEQPTKWKVPNYCWGHGCSLWVILHDDLGQARNDQEHD